MSTHNANSLSVKFNSTSANKKKCFLGKNSLSAKFTLSE